MTTHAQHATFEDREKADRAGADDCNVGAHGIGCHRNSLSMVSSMMVEAGSRPPPPTEWSGRPAGSSADRRLAERPLASEAETASFAAKLAAIVRAGDVVTLWGDLGTGKTALARALIRARGRPDEEVPSPTFTLVQIYEPADPDAAAVWHFDLFRIAAPEDALELGIDDAFASAVSLIEWPDRLGPLLPAHRLDLTLCPGPDRHSRWLTIAGDGGWRLRLHEAGLV
jgi:tRNA threonylcarbamoyladenosine biosynthesis protein TsaE